MTTYCIPQSSQNISSEKIEKEREWQNALEEAKKQVKEMFGEDEYEPTRVVFGPDGDRVEVTGDMLNEGWTYEQHRQQNNSTKSEEDLDALPSSAGLLLLALAGGIALFVILKFSK